MLAGVPQLVLLSLAYVLVRRKLSSSAAARV
jgi:hypothetical protein